MIAKKKYMNLIEIPEKKYKKYLPEHLGECDKVQYIEVSALIFNMFYRQLSYEDFRIHALYKLMDMTKKNSPKVEIMPFTQENSLNVDEDKFSKIYQLSEMLDTFFEFNQEGQRVLTQYYTHNPLPTIKVGLRNYRGPLDEFEKVTFGEYFDALENFINFNDTGEMIYLYNLAAIFYRPKKFFSRSKDKRVNYNPDLVPARAKKMKYQHIGVLYGIYLFFASFQKNLTTTILYIQGNEIDFSILFDGEKSKSDIPGLGMKGIMLSIAESGVYGNESQVRNVPLWDIFIRLYDITKRNLDEKAEYEKIQKK